MYQLKRLQHHHHKIVDLCLMGVRQMEIAKAVGITDRQVRNVFRSPLFQDELSRRRERMERVKEEAVGLATGRAKQIMNAATEDAARKLVDGLEAKDKRVQQASANAILDRVYGKAGTMKEKPLLTLTGASTSKWNTWPKPRVHRESSEKPSGPA